MFVLWPPSWGFFGSMSFYSHGTSSCFPLNVTTICGLDLEAQRFTPRFLLIKFNSYGMTVLVGIHPRGSVLSRFKWLLIPMAFFLAPNQVLYAFRLCGFYSLSNLVFLLGFLSIIFPQLNLYSFILMAFLTFLEFYEMCWHTWFFWSITALFSLRGISPPSTFLRTCCCNPS